MKAVKGEEIVLATENKVGKLSEITSLICSNGINIRAICAYADNGKAIFMLLTSDNTKAKQVLSKAGNLSTDEVVIVDMPDKVGELDKIASNLKQAGVDLNYIYGTTAEPGKSATLVISSNDNEKALEAISD